MIGPPYRGTGVPAHRAALRSRPAHAGRAAPRECSPRPACAGALAGRARASVMLALLLVAVAVQPAHAQIGDRLRRIARGAGQLARTLLPISTEKEIEIGRGFAATIAGRYPISQDADLTTYVNLVGLAVASEGARPDIEYRFAVLETPDVNAFAAPGGYVFITRGALGLIESESELAGVLAHEVAHVNRRHVIEGIRKADFMREVRDQAGLTGSSLDRAVGHGANVLFSGYSREDEAEADSIGVACAGAAGYDATGLPTFVSHLNSHAGQGPLAEIFATHERPEARLARLNRIIEHEGLSGGATLADRFVRNVRGRPAVQPPAARPTPQPVPPPTQAVKKPGG